jgi:hypothetical protein
VTSSLSIFIQTSDCCILLIFFSLSLSSHLDESWAEPAHDHFQGRGLVLPGVTWIAALLRPEITDSLHEDRHTFLIYLGQLFVEREMVDTKVVEKIETQFHVQ